MNENDELINARISDIALSRRLENLAMFNNQTLDNVNRFRIAGLDNNVLFSKQRQMTDIGQACARQDILVDMEQLEADWEKPGFKVFIDDGTNVMFSITVSSISVNTANFPTDERRAGLFIYDSTLCARPKHISAGSNWKGFHNTLILQAIDTRRRIEIICLLLSARDSDALC